MNEEILAGGNVADPASGAGRHIETWTRAIR